MSTKDDPFYRRWVQHGAGKGRPCEICDDRLYTDEFAAMSTRGGYRTAYCNEHYSLWIEYLEDHEDFKLLTEEYIKESAVMSELNRIKNRLYHVARIWTKNQIPIDREEAEQEA